MKYQYFGIPAMADEIKKDETNPKDTLGAKKPPISLFPPTALVHGAMVMKHGADKYGPYNWRDKKVQTMIYIDAAMRHLLAYIDGQTYDTESGLDHRAHVMASMAILLDAEENKNLIDNRPIKGDVATTIKSFSKSESNNLFYQDNDISLFSPFNSGMQAIPLVDPFSDNNLED